MPPQTGGGGGGAPRGGDGGRPGGSGRIMPGTSQSQPHDSNHWNNPASGPGSWSGGSGRSGGGREDVFDIGTWENPGESGTEMKTAFTDFSYFI